MSEGLTMGGDRNALPPLSFFAPSARLAFILSVALTNVVTTTVYAFSIELPICSGGDRAERKLTCIVDGDTGWQDGVKWRLTRRGGGVDTPEISKPECAAEAAAGAQARERLQALMSGGYAIEMGSEDRYGRALAVVTLADGRDAGDVLIGEGLAQPWPNSANPWCTF